MCFSRYKGTKSEREKQVYLIFIAASAKYLRRRHRYEKASEMPNLFHVFTRINKNLPLFFLLTRITMGVFDNLILHRSSRKCTAKCTEMCTILRVNTHAAQCDRGLKVHDMTLGHILTWDTDIYCQLMKRNLNR